MDYTTYSQRDDAWARVALGESDTTIGDYGCLLCSVASGLTDLGLRIHGLPPDPPRLNRWLARNQGFTDGNLFVFNSLGPLGVQLVEYVDARQSPAPVEKLERALALEECFAVIQVDFRPGGGAQQHWVRALTWYESDVSIMDPWVAGSTQQMYLMTRYALPSWDSPARAIYRLVVYRYSPQSKSYALQEGTLSPVVQAELCMHESVDSR